ncbi:MAG: hypothetical protein QM667_11070 [Asticcacaulis sp.]
MNIKQIAIAAAVALLPTVAHAAQAPLCKPEKTRDWPNNYSVMSGCRYRFPAPVPGRMVEFDVEGRFVFFDHGVEVSLAPFGAPSQFAWSPDGRYFYINDGQWSGIDSVLNLYDLNGGKVIANLTIRRDLNRIFATKIHCDVQSKVPTTWGIGWSKDVTQLYVLVQSLPGQYCGDEADFYVATVALPSGRVLAFEPASIARRKFHAMLPENMRKP